MTFISHLLWGQLTNDACSHHQAPKGANLNMPNWRNVKQSSLAWDSLTKAARGKDYQSQSQAVIRTPQDFINCFLYHVWPTLKQIMKIHLYFFPNDC